MINGTPEIYAEISPLVINPTREETRMGAVFINGSTAIVPYDSLADVSFPMDVPVINGVPVSNDISRAGVVILVKESGRGPIINNGEVISTGLLLDQLVGALDEDQLTPELNARLDKIPDLMRTQEEFGYAKNGDTVELGYLWNDRPPRIILSPHQGVMLHLTETQVGVDPDCITYTEILPQELVYGHTGIVNDNEFGIKAAILTKTTPVDVALAWTPAAITGPPIDALTTESGVTNTTVDCMAFRVQGTLGLQNTGGFEVSGSMHVQVSIDSGTWVDVAHIHEFFDATESTAVVLPFDEIIAASHGAHSYKFRGRLITDSDEEVSRELTGSLHVATVAEIGAGTVLTNDILLKWIAKE